MSKYAFCSNEIVTSGECYGSDLCVAGGVWAKMWRGNYVLLGEFGRRQRRNKG